VEVDLIVYLPILYLQNSQRGKCVCNGAATDIVGLVYPRLHSAEYAHCPSRFGSLFLLRLSVKTQDRWMRLERHLCQFRRSAIRDKMRGSAEKSALLR
jgi:hypothetical protein